MACPTPSPQRPAHLDVHGIPVPKVRSDINIYTNRLPMLTDKRPFMTKVNRSSRTAGAILCRMDSVPVAYVPVDWSGSNQM